MIRKLLVLALGLIVGGVALAVAQNADAAQAHSRRAHRTQRAKSGHHAKRHAARATSRSSRRHTARVSHASKAAPATRKATHRA